MWQDIKHEWWLDRKGLLFFFGFLLIQGIAGAVLAYYFMDWISTHIIIINGGK